MADTKTKATVGIVNEEAPVENTTPAVEEIELDAEETRIRSESMRRILFRA